MNTPEKSEAFVLQIVFDEMREEERAEFAKLREETGKFEDQVEREFGQNMMWSVQESWQGLIEMADVIHGDWGSAPNTLDEHTVGDLRRRYYGPRSDGKVACGEL